MGFSELFSRKPYKEREPEMARMIEADIHLLTGISGPGIAILGYTEWRSTDPTTINPRMHLVLDTVGVLPAGATNEGEYRMRGQEIHYKGGNITRYQWKQDVIYTINAIVVSPEDPCFFDNSITRIFLASMPGITEEGIRYGIRYMHQQEKQYSKHPQLGSPRPTPLLPA